MIFNDGVAQFEVNKTYTDGTQTPVDVTLQCTGATVEAPGHAAGDAGCGNGLEPDRSSAAGCQLHGHRGSGQRPAGLYDGHT